MHLGADTPSDHASAECYEDPGATSRGHAVASCMDRVPYTSLVCCSPVMALLCSCGSLNATLDNANIRALSVTRRERSHQGDRHEEAEDPSARTRSAQGDRPGPPREG